MVRDVTTTTQGRLLLVTVPVNSYFKNLRNFLQEAIFGGKSVLLLQKIERTSRRVQDPLGTEGSI